MLLEFTVGLQGGRTQVVDDLDPVSRKLKTRRIQAAVRRKNKSSDDVVPQEERKTRKRTYDVL